MRVGPFMFLSGSLMWSMFLHYSCGVSSLVCVMFWWQWFLMLLLQEAFSVTGQKQGTIYVQHFLSELRSFPGCISSLDVDTFLFAPG